MQLTDGSYVDTSGWPVNIEALVVDTTNRVGYQATEQSQEELFDVSNNASQFAMPSSNLPSLPSTGQAAAPSQNTIISVPSVQTVLSSVRHDGERRLVLQDAKSDLFEDHLLPTLDSGVNETMAFCSINNKPFISGIHVTCLYIVICI